VVNVYVILVTTAVVCTLVGNGRRILIDERGHGINILLSVYGRCGGGSNGNTGS